MAPSGTDCLFQKQMFTFEEFIPVERRLKEVGLSRGQTAIYLQTIANCNSGLTKPLSTQWGVLKYMLAIRTVSHWAKMASLFTPSWISH